jgi:arylsulfatase A-like enzyme
MLLTLALLLAAPAKPNVLLVLADDQRFDTIRALGNPHVHTPTLDALVGRGTTFTNAYNMGSMVPAVCTPSRTMLLTGRSLFRIPNPTAKQYAGPTLGGTFKDAGYDTLCVSKPGNSFRFGHDAFGKVVHVPHPKTGPSAGTCADAVIDWLKADRGGKPFFVYLAPSVPHDPRTAEPRFHTMYDPATLPLSKNFLPRHPFDNGELEVRDEKLAAVPRDEAEMKKHLAEYYACVTDLDHHVGRVIETLRTTGQLDNTLIVFTSDQGLAVGGRHGLMGKQNLYEHVKPPLLVAGPGVAKGTADRLVYLFDLFPTLCELTGVKRPDGLEGKSIFGPEKRDRLFTAYKDCQRSVRHGRWKLIWYPKVERVQLFDLSADADEVNDLSGTMPEQVAAMKKLLGEEQAAWGDK